MADSTMENADDDEQLEEEVITEEFHKAATVIAGSGPSLSGNEKTEIHILIEITYKNRTEARTSPQKHMMLLKALGNSFDATELEIFDNKNRKLSLDACKEMTKIEHYEAHFKIHQGKGRHFVIFCVLATVAFQTLKRDGAVLATLKKTGCYLKRHHWGQDKWDIVTLGFIMEMDPGRHLSDEVREQILEIAKAKDCVTTPGSRFKLVAQSFKIKNKSAVCNANAYGVQCMRIDAQAVDAMFKQTYRETKSYVKNKLQKEDPTAFTNALRIQNKYMTNVKTIILVGITRIMMRELRPLLLSEPNIDHVSATRKVQAIGRWDILTNDNHQAEVIETINEKLPTWLETMTTDPDRPKDYPEPGITNRTKNSNEDSSQGDVSYLSSSAGSYDSIMEADGGQYDEAPQQRSRNSVSVSGFSWAQVAAQPIKKPKTPSQGTTSNVSEITAPTVATTVAQSEEMNELKKLVTLLTNKVNDMSVILERKASTDQQPQQQQYNGYGYTQGGPLNYENERLKHEQYMAQQQWQFEQRMAARHASPPRSTATPPRDNRQSKPQDPRHNFGTMGQGGTKTTGLRQETTKRNNQYIEEDTEPAPKRSDDKQTPIKDTQMVRVESPPINHLRDQRMNTNPYNQPRELQFRHERSTRYYNPYNFLNKPGRENEMNPNGQPEYSQGYYPQFQYTPQSPDHGMLPHPGAQQDHYQYNGDIPMQGHEDSSHPAADAKNYTLL